MAVAAAALLPLALTVRGEDGPRSLREGVFSERQVERGRAVYEKTCQPCHLTEWFTDGTFMASWNGQPVHSLFAILRQTMPQDNPGGLKRRDYADVLAFIFSLNKLPTGTDEMKSDDRTLKQIFIEQPANGGSHAPSGGPQ